MVIYSKKGYIKSVDETNSFEGRWDQWSEKKNLVIYNLQYLKKKNLDE